MWCEGDRTRVQIKCFKGREGGIRMNWRLLDCEADKLELPLMAGSGSRDCGAVSKRSEAGKSFFGICFETSISGAW